MSATCKHCKAPKASQGQIPVFFVMDRYGAVMSSWLIKEDANVECQRLGASPDGDPPYRVREVPLKGPGLPIMKMLREGGVAFVPPGFYTKAELEAFIREIPS